MVVLPLGSASKLCPVCMFQCLPPLTPSCMLTMLDVFLGSLQWYVPPSTLVHLELPQFFQHAFSVCQDFSQPFLSTFSTGPPPPPPLPPPADLLEAPPKPPFADEEEEEEMLLRETCLMSMVNKRVAVTEVCSRLFLRLTSMQRRVM